MIVGTRAFGREVYAAGLADKACCFLSVFAELQYNLCCVFFSFEILHHWSNNTFERQGYYSAAKI